LLSRAHGILVAAGHRDTPAMALTLTRLAGVYIAKRKFGSARQLMQAALAIYTASGDAGPAQAHEETMQWLESVAQIEATRDDLVGRGRYNDAAPLQEQLYGIADRLLPPDHPYRADAICELAVSYQKVNRLAEAETLFRQALAMMERTIGPNDPRTGAVANNLGTLLLARGRHAEAEAIFMRVLATDEAVLEAGDTSLAIDLNNLARAKMEQGHYLEAKPLLERALEIECKAHGECHHEVAIALDNLAALQQELGRYREAEKLRRKALAVFKATLGPNHPETAACLDSLAEIERALGQYDAAERDLTEVYDINRQVFGERSPAVGTTLSSLGTLDWSRGDWSRAMARLQQGLAVLVEAYGEDDCRVATAIGKLGRLAQEMGDYPQAERRLREALRIMRQRLGEDDPQVVACAVLLAGFHSAKGDFAAAEPIYRAAVERLERRLGGEHPTVAAVLNDLGSLLMDTSRLDEAEQLTGRALAVREKVFGLGHRSVAQSANNLAEIQRLQGRYEQAAPLYQRALAAFEASLGPGHPEVAKVLNNIGLVRHSQGDYAKAVEALQRAAAIEETALGTSHPDLPRTLVNLAVAYWAQGSTTKALALLDRAGEARERNLRLLLSTGAERQRLAAVQQLNGEIDVAVAFHTHALPDDDKSLALAFTTVLRRKGRVLDALADTLGTMRRHLAEPDRQILERLAAVRARLATHMTIASGGSQPPSDERALRELLFEEERLQRELSERSPIHQAETAQGSLEQVRSRLPHGGALVEFLRYRPVDPCKATTEAFGTWRYVAYVLRPEGSPEWVGLGDSAEIDRLVELFRQALADKTREDVKEVARQLDERVMQPVRPLLRDAQLILLSPDGALNLIPFAALVDEFGDWLVTRYTFGYLSSGRDLLRTELAGDARSAPVVVAGPDYFMRGMEASRRQWGALPDTLDEADMIRDLFPDSVQLIGDQATEAALQDVHGPRLLHVATHGYFDADAPGVQFAVSPLLRSGLVLAGANGRPTGDQDGVLTALEVAGLDLWGTLLAVLSACETGGGELVAGEGIFGLRRSLVLAGAESQMISLWQISSAATCELMRGYYRLLQAGLERTEALRAQQREMLAGERFAHPYYWAAFIPSGAWHSLPETNPSIVH
jgi:CHAT domain-containing protein/Tfp pilus assembly protein PilF